MGNIYCRSERWIECTLCEAEEECVPPDHCTDPTQSTGDHDRCDAEMKVEFEAMEFIKIEETKMDRNIYEILLFGCVFGGLILFWLHREYRSDNGKYVQLNKMREHENYNSCDKC